MSIKQLNATYVADEDRVQFRFTTVADEEFRLWLTRAVTVQILWGSEQLVVKALEQVHAPSQAQMIAEFKQQSVKQNTPFHQQFQSAAKLPLGEAPLLVKKVEMRLEDAMHVLAMHLSNGQVLTLRLTEDLLSKLAALLQKISETARWGLQDVAALAPAKPAPVPASPGDAGPLLH